MKMYWIFLFIFIIGCSEKRKYPVDAISKNESLIIIDVDALQDAEVKYVSDLFHSVSATILDDTPESLIGEFYKMAVVEGFFIVLEKYEY